MPVSAPRVANGNDSRQDDHASDIENTSLWDQDPRPAASLSVAVLLITSCDEMASLVRSCFTGISVDLQFAYERDYNIDPRRVIDLILFDCARSGSIDRDIVRRSRVLWVSALFIAMRVRDQEDASALIRDGADFAVCADVCDNYLRAVVRGAGRRMHQANAELRIAFGDLVFDREVGRVWCAGKPVELTVRELQLFRYLFVHAGSVVSSECLEISAWRNDPSVCSNSLAVYIGYLRRKLSASKQTTLDVVRGRGYMLRLR